MVRAWRNRATVYEPLSPLRWTDDAAVRPSIVENLRHFAAASRAYERWCIAWCAGVGIVGTTADALASETAILRHVVSTLLTMELAPQRGVFFFASSAGGVYGDAEERPLTETTPVAPISDYGRNKIVQETLVAQLLGDAGVPVLLGRISNLYGPGQNLAKPQGFISHLLRSVLLRRTLNVYVPLDTRRDYLFAADAAEHVVACLDAMRSPGVVTKIFANGQSATIHQVLAVAGRVTRQRAHVVFQPSAMAKQQPRAHLYASRILTEIPLARRTTLHVGMKAVFDALLAHYQQATNTNRTAHLS